jgi:hypothetical protein
MPMLGMPEPDSNGKELIIVGMLAKIPEGLAGDSLRQLALKGFKFLEQMRQVWQRGGDRQGHRLSHGQRKPIDEVIEGYFPAVVVIAGHIDTGGNGSPYVVG